MNNRKHSLLYFLVLFAFVSLLTFSSCGDKEKDEPKPDFASLIVGDYLGEVKVGDINDTNVEGNVRAGNRADEVIFTQKFANSDSTAQFIIQLKDLNSRQGIDLFIPEQRVGNIQVAGKVLGNSTTNNNHGFFLYQNIEKDEIINELVFNISANGGDYVYTFIKE